LPHMNACPEVAKRTHAAIHPCTDEHALGMSPHHQRAWKWMLRWHSRQRTKWSGGEHSTPQPPSHPRLARRAPSYTGETGEKTKRKIDHRVRRIAGRIAEEKLPRGREEPPTPVRPARETLPCRRKIRRVVTGCGRMPITEEPSIGRRCDWPSLRLAVRGAV